MPAAIRFYFDYVSPNAYLAWTQLPRIAARYGVGVEPVPVLFAALLEAHGQLGPAEVPAKLRWMHRSNLRKAALLQVPINPPAFHPFNPLLALRVSSLPLAEAERRALIDALFAAVWVRALHVSEAAVVERVADEAGLDGAALLSAAASAECKARLREHTDTAIARGVFGVPTIAAGDELFWGYDDLPQLELFLAGQDPLDATEWQKWAAAPTPSAQRRSSGTGEGVGEENAMTTHGSIAGVLGRTASVALVAVASAVLGGCTSLEQYSIRVAEQSCDAVSVCTVYGPNGETLSPCTNVGRQTVYPGDPRWPYTTPGVCDAVRDGKVVSTRAGG